jgi:hypothetical protein
MREVVGGRAWGGAARRVRVAAPRSAAQRPDWYDEKRRRRRRRLVL